MQGGTGGGGTTPLKEVGIFSSYVCNQVSWFEQDLKMYVRFLLKQKAMF